MIFTDKQLHEIIKVRISSFLMLLAFKILLQKFIQEFNPEIVWKCLFLKVGIIYETKRKKATVQVVEWLENALKNHNVEVTAGKPEEFDNLDFDAFIIGSSVYAGQVQQQLLEFIEARKEEIGSKPVAAFVVCKEVEHPREENLIQILDKLPTEPITDQCFEGYMLRRGNFDRQQSKAEDWVRDFVSKLS